MHIIDWSQQLIIKIKTRKQAENKTEWEVMCLFFKYMQQTCKTSPVPFCFQLLIKREFPHLDTASGKFLYKAHQSFFRGPKGNLKVCLNIVSHKSWMTQSGCNAALQVPYCRGQKSCQGSIYDLFFFPTGINVTGSNMRSESGICISVRQELLLMKIYQFSRTWKLHLPGFT